MDLTAVLSEVQSWSSEDRLRLIGEVWDGLSAEDCEISLSDDLRELLDQRVAALDADPGDVVTWDEIKASARRSR